MVVNTETRLPGDELYFGLVTPVGTSTLSLAAALRGSLSAWGYESVVIRLTDHLPDVSAVAGEPEDLRVRRLIAAGNAFCAEHEDDAALARLAVREVRRTRTRMLRQDGSTEPADQLIERSRPRTAYIIHSLKRTTEVRLLREAWGSQFLVVASQAPHQERVENLLSRPLSSTDPAAKQQIVRDLMRTDADDTKPFGQRVSKTYPQADFFLDASETSRAIDLLFGDPVAPTTAEFAMYVALAASGRSLAASRKVGAALVKDASVIATGHNDVPAGQVPDVLAGVDTSETFKRENLRDTLNRLAGAGILAVQEGEDQGALIERAAKALHGGQLLDVIEYQRAVHAEAKAMDDAAARGVSAAGAELFVTTYPCHLCYKQALDVGLSKIHYIDPYPKSRATDMYPEQDSRRLFPYEGVAPRRYVQLFNERDPFLSDPSGKFSTVPRDSALPLLSDVLDDATRLARERLAVSKLKEAYQ